VQACGTIASIHSIVNAAGAGSFELVPGSILEAFKAKSLSMAPDERGWELARTKEVNSGKHRQAFSRLAIVRASTTKHLPALNKRPQVQEISDATAAAGETAGAGTDDAQDQHFVCFVHVGGTLYELDGCVRDESGLSFPLAHGPTTAESFLHDAAQVIKAIMARDPTSVSFNVTALCKLDE
jgi:hypothetical protein